MKAHFLRNRSQYKTFFSIFSLLCLLTLGVTRSTIGVEATDVPEAKREIQINVDGSELSTTYGKYAETEVSLSGTSQAEQVEWKVTGYDLPPGLDLENTTKTTALIFGTPTYTGYWCFDLSARVVSTGTTVFREICYYGEDNGDFKYPVIFTERLLPIGRLGQFYQEAIKVEAGTAETLNGQIESGALPLGFEMVPNQAGLEFLIKGRPEKEDSKVFSLKIQDADGGTNYRQFLLIIEDTSPITPPLCPAGQHWDPYLQRCVFNQTPLCPTGYYYDPYTGRCVLFSTHPVCSWGYHWSWSFNRCVPNFNPHPIPHPNPHPHPVPHPHPMPIPHPMPHPMPNPIPHPMPNPMPNPIPHPMPNPMPNPVPHPMPNPMPNPIPHPMPNPMPNPIPHPMPNPMPNPIPHPMPNPMPNPMPHPMPMPHITIDSNIE